MIALEDWAVDKGEINIAYDGIQKGAVMAEVNTHILRWVKQQPSRHNLSPTQKIIDRSTYYFW